MITAIRTEVRKLRTIRQPWGLLALCVALTALFTILRASRAGTTGHMAIPALNTAAGVTRVITGTEFGLLLAMVAGSIIVTGEFRHSTITGTYLATPDRLKVLLAKLPTAAALGALFGLAATVVTTGLGLAFVAGKGYPLALGTATILRYGAGSVLGAALLAMIGVGAGSLVRSQLATSISVFVWSFVVEQLIGGLFSSVAPYLPFTAATSLGGTPIGAATALPFAAAAAVVVGAAALLCAVAARTTVRADVS